ncbi:MAG: ribonuclease HII [Anaerolineaceae bacterium]|nr:ribonuclease HII [Anaerolineaceae bacterium]
MINREIHVKELAAFDSTYRQKGIIAGMDEVGRGPLAGNVVTACVVMPDSPLLLWVDDSKKLSETRREKVYDEIMRIAIHVGIGQVGPEEIDRINILQATKKAMEQAAENMPASLFLIDAVHGLKLPGEEIALIKGDALSYSIAAASIIAKVTRDRQMEEMDKLYPEYGFIRNKGYGTREHIEAIKKYGPCPIHRRSFIGKFL